MSRVLPTHKIWEIPITLGVLSLVGLVAALVADGVGDAVSWIALAIPAVVSARGFRRRTPRSSAPTAPTRKAVRPSPPPRS